jgi:hypothetical protein
MWKLEKSEAGDFLVLTLCGRMEVELLTELQRILDSEGKNRI